MDRKHAAIKKKTKKTFQGLKEDVAQLDIIDKVKEGWRNKFDNKETTQKEGFLRRCKKSFARTFLRRGTDEADASAMADQTPATPRRSTYLMVVACMTLAVERWDHLRKTPQAPPGDEATDATVSDGIATDKAKVPGAS